MILREFWGLDGPAASSVEFGLPLVVPVPGGTAIIDAGDGEGRYVLRLERTVDAGALRLRRNTRTRRPGSDAEIPMIEIDRSGREGSEIARDIAASLSFLADQPFTLSKPPLEDQLVPETEEDEAVLREFGTREIWLELSSNPQIRTFREPITSDLVAALLPKGAGVQLYAEALRHGSEVGRYRDYWRVLESAFAMKDDRLIASLAAYPPAVELGFTRDELEDLRVFRGRASHAESRAGSHELRQVQSAVTEREGRLKTLVERVLMTKKQWGSRSAAVDELVPLKAWVGRGSVDEQGRPRPRIVLLQRPGKVGQ